MNMSSLLHGHFMCFILSCNKHIETSEICSSVISCTHHIGILTVLLLEFWTYRPPGILKAYYHPFLSE
jgi:hypothetical protein